MKTKIRLAIWSLFATELYVWSIVVATHQEFVWRFPGMLEAYSVLLLVSMVVLEIAISILPSSKRATFARSRIVISALIFLFFTVLITNPFDWIPQGHHAIRSPYWDVFALNLAGAVVFWLLTSGIPRNKKQIHESPS